MKKLLSFLRSMRFGLLLMLPVLLCSLVGSVIPQGESESYYAAQFPSMYHLILGLGLNRVFGGWFFLLLSGLFGVNLALCSASQLKAVPGRITAAENKAKAVEIEPVDGFNAAASEAYLSKHRWRRADGDGRRTYVSSAPGWYGSVVTHFAILGVLIGAAGIFALSSVNDCVLMPGSNDLPGGVTAVLSDFRITDDAGKIDYVSTLEIETPNGKSSGVREIRVNHPLRFGSNKYYQQSYGISGEINVTVRESGETEHIHVTETNSIINVGGAEGIWFYQIYPGYTVAEDGSYSLITKTYNGEYPDPVYYVTLMSNGSMQPMLVFPGDTVETNDAVYEFEAPLLYPSIRVKTTSVWVYALLYLSFAALTLGLYLCFFVPNTAVAVDDTGYVVVGKKWETELRMRFRQLK